MKYETLRDYLSTIYCGKSETRKHSLPSAINGRKPDTLLEDFIIRELKEAPHTKNVFDHVLEHYGRDNYSVENPTPRGRLLRNPTGEGLLVNVVTGKNYVAVRVQTLKATQSEQQSEKVLDIF